MTICSQCFSTDIIFDAASGNTACASCGFVLDSSSISSEVTFGETAGGAARLLGQSLGLNESGIRFSNPLTATRESREVTLGRARQTISRLAACLNMPTSAIDAAERLYLLALQHGFTRGRNSELVCASCLYAVCRREKLPVMLIDLSESIKCNLYTLGHTYLRLVGTLHLELPLVDPSLYIHRFAHKLELGKKEHIVAQTALQIVKRMKRDWLHIGRRPSGLCGAALVLSARMYGFDRSFEEVSRIVKICNSTLQKRLLEFAQSPVAELTSEEFLESNIDSFPANEPPAVMERAIKDAAQSELMTEVQSNFDNQLERDRDSLDYEYGVEEDLSYLDDQIDCYIATEEEAKFRGMIWDEMFGKYVERMEHRRKETDKGIKVPRRKRDKTNQIGQSNTPKVLSRININAMDDLFQEEESEMELSEEENAEFVYNQEVEYDDEFGFLQQY
ncbi:hypothetical protein GEMRC1_005600 [Eukaryota sp. GEM-RC1]